MRASRGEQVSLDCLTEGEPPAAVEWMKDGVRLQESDRVQVQPNGTLWITDVRSSPEQSDKGVYQCLAQNKHGAMLSQRSRLSIPGACNETFSLQKCRPNIYRGHVMRGSTDRFSCCVSTLYAVLAAASNAIVCWPATHRNLLKAIRWLPLSPVAREERIKACCGHICVYSTP